MKKDLSKHYNPKETEDKWYSFWQKNNFFSSKPNKKKPFTVILPPPNVTGVLHMGHMLNGTIQDVLVRRARMQGYNACWIPGTDHASIATEAKVVQKLREEEGKTKSDIGREEFLKKAWQWTYHHGDIIYKQLKKIGVSCDWNRSNFTLDPKPSASVIKFFVKLYNEGYIYRDLKMLNWDPIAKTTISDEEVIYKEQNTQLIYIKYQIKDSQNFITIATVRPETILGDVAICVNPKDLRFQHFIGKTAIVPICNREIPIIADDYVDITFGTGCLKITPAHDMNDYELGIKHKLPIINTLNEDATLNENGMHYQGLSREEARKKIVIELDNLGLIEKRETYKNSVGTSERTGSVIEPRLSLQWFVKMKELVAPAIECVLNKEVELIPEKFTKTYLHWMYNVRDWNISRQLWWGHQIPAYFYDKGDNDFVVAETKEEALKLAKQKINNPNLTFKDLKQDDDALDTWFSSALWPISVFDGVTNPNNEDITYYYPTNVLVTAPEILFFWVARMILAGFNLRDQKPFSKVYLTGIVRDAQKRKMSKSLGNSPDPIKLMEEYSTDGVRMGLLFSSPAGNDLLFDEKLCLQGRNFNNKLWNSFRLIQGWEKISENIIDEAAQQAIIWFEHKLNSAIITINNFLEAFKISEATKFIYNLIWNEFCSYYLEAIKPKSENKINENYYNQTIVFLETLLKLLHPFIPFITEEIWQNITERELDNALVIQKWPEAKEFDEEILNQFELSKAIISQVRDFRANYQLANKKSLDLITKISKLEFNSIIKKLANLNQISKLKERENYEELFSFRILDNEFYIPFKQSEQDKEQEKQTLLKELEYNKGFLISVQKKLANQNFIDNAPKKVIEMEYKKENDTLIKIKSIEKKLK